MCLYVCLFWEGQEWITENTAWQQDSCSCIFYRTSLQAAHHCGITALWFFGAILPYVTGLYDSSQVGPWDPYWAGPPYNKHSVILTLVLLFSQRDSNKLTNFHGVQQSVHRAHNEPRTLLYKHKAFQALITHAWGKIQKRTPKDPQTQDTIFSFSEWSRSNIEISKDYEKDGSFQWSTWPTETSASSKETLQILLVSFQMHMNLSSQATPSTQWYQSWCKKWPEIFPVTLWCLPAKRANKSQGVEWMLGAPARTSPSSPRLPSSCTHRCLWAQPRPQF